jgi:hypothetical protein
MPPYFGAIKKPRITKLLFSAFYLPYYLEEDINIAPTIYLPRLDFLSILIYAILFHNT